MASKNGKSSDAEGGGPLTPAVFYILLALFGGDMHGYDIMRQVEKDSEGRATMGPGTLYGSIDRMMAAGLVARAPNRSDDPRRIYYRITAAGKRTFEAEAERMAHAAKVAAIKRMGLSAHGNAR